jgi:hypothetical protein
MISRPLQDHPQLLAKKKNKFLVGLQTVIINNFITHLKECQWCDSLVLPEPRGRLGT